MKLSSLLVSVFLALASGHYVDEEPQGRYEERPENHVRAHQEGPRHYDHEEGRYENPPKNHVRSHHKNGLKEGPGHYADEEGRYENPPENHARSHHKNGPKDGPHHFGDEEDSFAGRSEEANYLRDNGRSHESHVRAGHKAAKHQPTVEERNEHVDVIIVGAGAAGLSAAHQFDYAGWTYKVLEADADLIGGRTRRSDSFGFGIDLGAEFLHTNLFVGGLAEYKTAYDLLNEMVQYDLDASFGETYTKEEPKQYTVLYKDKTGYKEKDDYHRPPEYRWKGDMTWHNFITEYVAYDEVRENIVNGCAVNSIDSGGSDVKVTCSNHSTYTADHVIVTVPIKKLQEKAIEFKRELGDAFDNAVKRIMVGGAFKIWLEFDKKWYPDYFMHEGDFDSYKMTWDKDEGGDPSNPKAGYRYFYDEMYPYRDSKDAKYNRHILGGLIYGYFADLSDYKGKSLGKIKDEILQFLRELPTFQESGATYTGNWELEDWSQDEFIKGGYTIYAKWKDQAIISESYHEDKVLFAGEALNQESWGSVHGAAQTGRAQADKLIKKYYRK